MKTFEILGRTAVILPSSVSKLNFVEIEPRFPHFFKKVDGVNTLRVRTEAFIPGELTLTLGNIEEEKVKKAIIPFLSYREYIKPTFVEKSADWLSKNFPLENK